MTITNPTVANHDFLRAMFDDDYFPDTLVEKGRQILLKVCERIEQERPKDAAAVLAITHEATERFNDLAEEFDAEGSELETAAREAIAADLDFILETYGFEVDIEEAIAPREW